MNFKYLSLSLLICFLISAENISAQRTYKNPILTGMNPDPSICKAGEDFYMLTYTFEYFSGLPIYQSKDVVNWKQIGHALSSKTIKPITG